MYETRVEPRSDADDVNGFYSRPVYDKSYDSSDNTGQMSAVSSVPRELSESGSTGRLSSLIPRSISATLLGEGEPDEPPILEGDTLQLDNFLTM